VAGDLGGGSGDGAGEAGLILYAQIADA